MTISEITAPTFSKKASRPLIVKGLTLQEYGGFIVTAKMLGLKYSEFLNLLLSSYYEANPIVKSVLFEREFHATVNLIHPERPHLVRNPRIDQLIRETREMNAQGRLSDNAKAYRIEKMLMPYLKDKSVPETQKKDIIQFIDSTNGGIGDV